MKAATIGQSYRGVIEATLVCNGVSIGLLLLKITFGGSLQYAFLLWNLFLAWLPVLFAFLLWNYLKKQSWLSWQGVVLSLLWLGFLPNSFYLATDLMHVRISTPSTVLYDVTLFLSFTFNGFIAGFASVYIIHTELLKRMKKTEVPVIICAVFVIASFALYLGRNLRWNTWDVIVNPAGVLFDVSDRLINPTAHPQAFVTTATFFVLTTSLYLFIWRLVTTLRHD